MANSSQPGFLASFFHLIVFSLICAASCLYYLYTNILNISPIRKKSKERDDERKKVVVVTGCDRGFGRLLVERILVEESSKGDKSATSLIVIALSLTEAATAELLAFASSPKCDVGNVSLLGLKCDVTSEKDVKAMKDKVETVLEQEDAILHTLVNNAGIVDPGDFVWYKDLDSHRRVMEVNFFGMLRVTQSLLPLMLRTSTRSSSGSKARIINLSSVCGTSACAANSGYNASKFAVEAWSDSLRLELEPFRIEVAKVRPGHYGTKIQTDFNDNLCRNFEQASDPIRKLYGGDDYTKIVKSRLDVFAESYKPSSPNLVVDVLMDLITTTKVVKSHYWIGSDAHTFWRALQFIPTSVADKVKGDIMRFPLPKARTATPPPPNGIPQTTIKVRNLDPSRAIESKQK